MSKERELLERVAKKWDSGNFYCSELNKDIHELLSTPEPEQDEEPVAWMKEDEDGDLEFNTLNQFSCGRTNGIPLFLHPAPRKPFVRLSEEEIEAAYGNSGHYQTLRPQDRFGVFALARAIEDALEKANK